MWQHWTHSILSRLSLPGYSPLAGTREPGMSRRERKTGKFASSLKIEWKFSLWQKCRENLNLILNWAMSSSQDTTDWIECEHLFIGFSRDLPPPQPATTTGEGNSNTFFLLKSTEGWEGNLEMYFLTQITKEAYNRESSSHQGNIINSNSLYGNKT